MKPHWLTKEEIESQLNNCELLFGIGSLKGKWYFVDRDFEGIKGPYDTYPECVKDCFDYLFNEPHWLTKEEVADLMIESKGFLTFHCGPDATTKMNNKWYFYNETYSELCGPYQTREDAQKAQEEYEDTL